MSIVMIVSTTLLESIVSKCALGSKSFVAAAKTSNNKLVDQLMTDKPLF